MKRARLNLAFPLGCLLGLAGALAAQPTVSNVAFTQGPNDPGPGGVATSQLVVTYDLVSASGPCEVTFEVSTDGGVNFVPAPADPAHLAGDIGADVAPGTARQFTWLVGLDLPDVQTSEFVVRVIANDGTCPDCMLWSNPAIWGGVKPVAGQNVVIPADWHLILDEDTPALGGLTINGTLEFAREDLNLTARYIMVHGELQVGSPGDPFAHQATITVNDTNTATDVMGMGTRGIMVMGGRLSLHGTPPATTWTKLNEHAPAGASSFTLMEPVDWNAGDQVVIAPTDFHTVVPTAQLGITERFTLASVAGDAFTTAETLDHARWGRLQYATTSGMSETPPAPGSPEEIVLTPEQAGTPLVLDQRAEVGNLTRNIVIQAPDDTLWQDDGFGVHVMVMGPGSEAFVDGVEIRRGGQFFSLGRYPFHWHMLSYAPPATLADATGQYLRNSVINESANRGIVVHGTNGVEISNNIVYDVAGHAVFTEDAVERRNVFDRNLVLRVNNPAQALKQHELELGSPGLSGGASGFWISNPDNVLTNNVAADCGAFGFWLAFTPNAWGASMGVPMAPRHIALDTFDNNTAHTTRFEGLMLDQVETQPDGTVSSLQYFPTPEPNGLWPSVGQAYANRIPFELTRFTVWKAGKHGIWDRASGPKNRQIISADNCQKFFSGSGEEGLIERCLVVGNSLNSASARPWTSGDPAPSGFATYHSAFDVRDNVIVNFPLYPGQTSGAFAEDDFYFRPVEKGTVRNSGNTLINSHPGYKGRAFLAGTGSYQPYASWFNLAPAKWDPHGLWGPEGNYIVYDTPFHTFGMDPGDVLEVAPSAADSGALSVPGPFYGFTAFVLHGHGGTPPQNHDYDDRMELVVRRLDPADLNQVVGEWRVAGIGDPNALLAHMRDFAAHPGGIYDIEFPFNANNPGWSSGLQHPTRIRMEFEGMLEASDTVLVGVHYSGAQGANVWVNSPGNVTGYTPLGSLEAVRLSDGGTFWQDTTNNRVWVKLRGGTWQPGGWAEFVTTPDMLLYETTYLNITAP